MLTTCSRTDIGRKRSLNQDTVYSCNVKVGNLDNLFIVADGMGGHKAGDYASAYTVKAIEREVKSNEDNKPIKILNEAIICANNEVHEKAMSEEDFAGMGTTVVCATICDNTLYVGNVGDSRLYVIDDAITQITKDHSLVEEMVRIGEIKKEEARLHPDKNIITRAIGAEKDVAVDFFEVELKDGDYILMCSDGLSNMVPDDEIFSVIKAGSEVKQIADDLVRVANQNGGKDNIGVVLIKFEGVSTC